ncbi:MAG: hypothetical protein LBQ50_07685 [Planctomycetaceae bacterium]|jgi:hypothetical protein|nr:hypothetical protein [Planctomycetaceae bacterium]
MMKTNLFLGLSLTLLLFSGCGDKVGLGGKVTFSDDGSPLVTGTVCFETDTYLARGTLKPDGSYVVGSLSEKDGLPPGNYRVYISGAEKEIGQDREGMAIMEPLIDAKFASGSTSELSLEVTSSTKTFDIKVDRYVPTKK